MKTKLKSIFKTLGFAVIGASIFTSCSDMGNSSTGGNRVMGNPKNQNTRSTASMAQ